MRVAPCPAKKTKTRSFFFSPPCASLSWKSARMPLRVASPSVSVSTRSGVKVNFSINVWRTACASRTAYCSAGNFAYLLMPMTIAHESL